MSEAASVPVRWGEEDYDWKVDLPGRGHSQPVLWGERLFVTSAAVEGEERVLISLDAEKGSTRWVKRFPSATHEKHRLNSYASSTPAVDAERVYVAFSTESSYSLRAIDHQGKEAWECDLGPFVSQHGSGTSPVLFEDLVILANEQDGKSSIVAVDSRTGRLRWETPRRTEEAAYGTPCIHRGEGGPELILTSHAHGISSLDPRSGKPNWEALVFDKRTVSSPILAPGLAIGTCGSGGGGNFLIAVRLGGKSDVTSTHVAYKLVQSIPYVPTPILQGGLLFLWSDRGIVSCVEPAKGEVLWQERAGGTFAGSPVCAGGRLYSMSAEGEVVVVKAGRSFELLARNPLGEGTHSTPAIAGGRLYLRTFTRLLAIGGKRRVE